MADLFIHLFPVFYVDIKLNAAGIFSLNYIKRIYILYIIS